MGKIDFGNLTKKQERQFHTWLRAIIQLLYFLFIPSAFTAAFAGVKYIFTQIGVGERIELTSFVTVLIVLCVYTIIFGRFFCGFVCAFGSFGDAVHAIYVFICKKLKKKPIKLSSQLTEKLAMIKYVVLALICIMCFLGVYGKARGTSPWDVFSMVHAFNFKLGGYVIGIVILIVMMVGMAIQERFFCRFFCPMGAIFALLPVLPFFSLHRDRPSCLKGCRACTNICPSDVELPNDGNIDVCGDCFQCQKCIDICPKTNIHAGIKLCKGNEMILTVVRALIMLMLFVWLGL